MVLSLIQIKEKLKPQFKTLLEVDDFRITAADHKNNLWIIMVEYQIPEKSLTGTALYYKIKNSVLKITDEDGNIEEMLSI